MNEILLTGHFVKNPEMHYAPGPKGLFVFGRGIFLFENHGIQSCIATVCFSSEINDLLKLGESEVELMGSLLNTKYKDENLNEYIIPCIWITGIKQSGEILKLSDEQNEKDMSLLKQLHQKENLVNPMDYFLYSPETEVG